MAIPILLIDDDILFGDVCRDFLEKSGYKVYYQNSLTLIGSVIQAVRPHLILLDVEVGNENGLDKLDEIHCITPDMPVVIVTSHRGTEAIEQALERNNVYILYKPFGVDELLSCVRRRVGTIPPALMLEDMRIGSCLVRAREYAVYYEDRCVRSLGKLEFSVLRLLYAHRGEIVFKEEFRRLWGNSIMPDHSLYNLIRALRKAFECDGSVSIERIKGGYRLSVAD